MKHALTALAAAGVFAAGAVVGSVVADVRVGQATIWDEAANRSTPTGRNFDTDVKDVVGEVVREELLLRFPDEEAPPVP